MNARSKFWGDDGRAAFRSWAEVADPRNPLPARQGVNERIMLRELLRRPDALVRLHAPLVAGKIGGAYEPGYPGNLLPETLYGPNAGLTEMLIPAGYVRQAYDPVFRLSADGTRYETVHSDVVTELDAPGLPFSLVFREEPGREDVLLEIASSYEAASRRRAPPVGFGEVGKTTVLEN